MTVTRALLRVAAITTLLLTIPAVAMLFTKEVNWGPGDFLIMGALLFGTGAAYVLITRNLASRTWRMAVGAGLAFVLLTVWAQLAVGIL